ncbi:MAG: anthranilate synthase component I [Burkholderiaceae bacterium]|jgi:anthranilate synthase component 1|nr:anthranilate synthase component I [Burkholderiaceae bacterium]
MTESEFDALTKQGYNRIPLVLETVADIETPLSLYIKLTRHNSKNSFLLESVVGGERFGRYSFIGLPASTVLHVHGMRTEVVRNGQVIENYAGNPLDFIATYLSRFRVAIPPGLPRFCGGLAGYFSYDTVRYIEPRLWNSAPPDDLGLPDIRLLLTEEIAVIDNLTGKLYLIVYANLEHPDAYARARTRILELRTMLDAPIVVPVAKEDGTAEVVREMSKEHFLAIVEKTKEYIARGDCMQVVLGQRLKRRYTSPPLSLYRSLRSLNPSPYLYYYDFGDMHIVGSSPEILVRQEITREGTRVIVRPLAGTRPRGDTPEKDAQLAADLLSDEKEIAEHVMLIDLARNDIGRIARIGSVQVTEKMAIEKYSHVQHIVSHVEGILKPGLSNLDVLKATFPAGTLSGAPKVRAMEIIDEMEPVKRGVYGGACGYISFGGEMDLAIAIRTGLIHDNTLYVQAGAGIVADSRPEAEWQETENKARAVIRAAEQVPDHMGTFLR